MEKYVCIHGHFYQPPRENPWLEEIEIQDSAYPYHDWNERITAECYEPNTASRILDGQDRITQIVNNYSRISFNFGPTLLAWMERSAANTYQAVLEADRKSRDRFSGHGSAVAQVYNHMIMPLSNRRDKITQVIWGIRDFRHRFGRQPEGMWLAETAVDLETLEILVQNGIRYTILSPYQAGKVRKRGGRKWHDVTGGRIDPTTPYQQKLPSGRSIALFFYDGPISQGIAFEGTLTRGEELAHRLLGAFAEGRPWPQLVHIATDGESYGHHHGHGDMALAYALHYIEEQQLARLTNYGEYLERHPRMPQVEIVQNTAWSCVHGVERWRSNCGCNSGRPGWHQHWRRPLRDALDWLRDTMALAYEQMASQFFTDPWRARDDFIAVILDRSNESIAQFFHRHARQPLEADKTVLALKLLELQRNAMLMYTSCGWFFDELSGIETVQVIQYAGRVIQLAEELFLQRFEADFLRRLELAKSNLSQHGDGRAIYEKWIKPAMVDVIKVGAHYAASSLFEDYPDETDIYCFTIQRRAYKLAESGPAKIAFGQCEITSTVTHESAILDFACVHLGDHNLVGGVRAFAGEQGYQAMSSDLDEAFGKADFPEMVRRMDHHFRGAPFALTTLFREEQRKILNIILDSSLKRAEAAYRHQYDHQMLLATFLGELGITVPKTFRVTAEIVLNADLEHYFTQEELDLRQIRSLFEQAKMWQVQLDDAGLSYRLGQVIHRLAWSVRQQQYTTATLVKLEAVIDLANELPIEVNLFHAQNVVYDLLSRMESTNGGTDSAQLGRIAEKLKIRV